MSDIVEDAKKAFMPVEKVEHKLCLPAEIKPALMGIEGMDIDMTKDFIFPFAKLNKDNGKITNSLTDEELPSEFIPIKFFRRYVKFNKKLELEWSTENPTKEQLEECKFHGDEKPLANETINCLALFKGIDIPITITFKRTSLPAGRALLTMACAGSKIGVFEKKFNITTQFVQKDFKYYVLKIKPAGKTTAEELEIAKSSFELFKTREVKSDIEDGYQSEEEVF